MALNILVSVVCFLWRCPLLSPSTPPLTCELGTVSVFMSLNHKKEILTALPSLFFFSLEALIVLFLFYSFYCFSFLCPHHNVSTKFSAHLLEQLSFTHLEVRSLLDHSPVQLAACPSPLGPAFTLGILSNSLLPWPLVFTYVFKFFFLPSLWKSISSMVGGNLVAKLCLSLATPWTVDHQAPLPMGFSRQAYWSGLPFPSPGDLPNPGIKPGSPALQADSLPTELWGKPTSSIVSYTHKKTGEILKLCKSAHGFIASCFLVDSLAGYGILGWKLFPAKLCRCHSLMFPFSVLLLRKLHLFWLQSLCAFFKAPLSSLVWTLPWCVLWCGSLSALREPNSIWKRLTLLQF